MKISVLVPVYGVEKYIGRCAESLFTQTYADLEYVFVDDCTPDRSVGVLRSVMEQYPERKAQVRIIRNERNSGIGTVRQRLIDECTGDCLTFVDSDDYLPPRAVELMATEMERSGADMVDGGWQRVTREGVSDVNQPYRGRDEKRYLCLMLCQNIVSNRMWGRLYRRALFTDNGVRLMPGVDFCEDFSVMTRLMFYARRSFICDPVYFYSDDNSSSYTHTTSPRHVSSFLKSNRIVLDFFTANDPQGRYSAPLQIGMLNVMRIMRRHGLGFSEADRLLGYRPRGAVFCLLYKMIRSKCPFAIAEKAYLAVRKAYVLTMQRDSKWS